MMRQRSSSRWSRNGISPVLPIARAPLTYRPRVLSCSRASAASSERGIVLHDPLEGGARRRRVWPAARSRQRPLVQRGRRLRRRRVALDDEPVYRVRRRLVPLARVRLGNVDHRLRRVLGGRVAAQQLLEPAPRDRGAAAPQLVAASSGRAAPGPGPAGAAPAAPSRRAPARAPRGHLVALLERGAQLLQPALALAAQLLDLEDLAAHLVVVGLRRRPGASPAGALIARTESFDCDRSARAAASMLRALRARRPARRRRASSASSRLEQRDVALRRQAARRAARARGRARRARAHHARGRTSAPRALPRLELGAAVLLVRRLVGPLRRRLRVAEALRRRSGPRATPLLAGSASPAPRGAGRARGCTPRCRARRCGR